jgi:NADPH2:quinone reductase
MIRTQAIGVNRADLGRRRTAAAGDQEPPRIPGLDVAGVVASERVERGRQLGAEASVNYSTENVTEALLRLADGRGIDVVLDGVIFDATLGALAQGGRVVTVGGYSGPRSRYEEQDLAKKGQWVRQMGVFNEAQEDVDQRGWTQMKSWFETGMLRTVVQEVFPRTEAKRVQELLASRGVFGKVVTEVR